MLLLTISYMIVGAVYRKRAKRKINEIREGKGLMSLGHASLIMFGMPAIGSTVNFSKSILFFLFFNHFLTRDPRSKF